MTNDEIYEFCKPYTAVQKERLMSVIDSIDYICKYNLAGDIVECGVWKGGCMMAAALTLIRNNRTDKKIYLFDTFEGMTDPTQYDYLNLPDQKILASDLLNNEGSREAVLCAASLDSVKQNMSLTKYPEQHTFYVVGDVMKTLEETKISKISYLRLDTDWYESTRKELKVLYPKLVRQGILTIDDYGHWAGSRKAVDEYFAKQHRPPYMNTIDYTGRLIQKF